MEQEVRSSDIFTMLANFIESNPHGIQNSQSNNNNSNPVSSLGSNAICNNSSNPQRTVTVPQSSQVAVVTTQPSNSTVNVQMLDIASPACSAAAASTSDAEMAEIERISSTFINTTFPAVSSTTNNSVPGEALIYDGANSIGMAEVVGNVLDSRMSSYPPHSLDFSITQNQAALLEALTTMDKDNFPETSVVSSATNMQTQPCVRTDTTCQQTVSYAHSFVSLLQQQSQIDNSLWAMNSVQNSSVSNFVGSVGNKQRVDVNNNNVHALSTVSNGISNMIGQSSNRLEHNAAHDNTHLMYNVPPSKTSKHKAHSTRTVPAIETSQHFVPNDALRLNQGKHSDKNRTDLVLPLRKENGDTVQVTERSKEKRLTTTPIPSDADKSSSSCSSSSSGSISGPEQSPDHITERISSGRVALSQQGSENTFTDPLHKIHARRDNGNGNGLRSYPCYNNVNVMNFDTINFSPVMDTTTVSVSEISGENRKVQSTAVDVNCPVPTSDSVVEIDATVTSPLENIPVSPSTPTTEQGNPLSPLKHKDLNVDRHSRNISGNGMSYSNLQMVSAGLVQQERNTAPTVNHPSFQQNQSLQKSNTKKLDPARKPSSGHKQHKVRDPNSIHMTNSFIDRNASEIGSNDSKAKEKQKKPRGSKHHRQKNDLEQIEKAKSQEHPTFHHLQTSGMTAPNHTGGSGLKPKVNADPTQKMIFPITTQDREKVSNNLAKSTPICHNALPINPDFNRTHITLPATHQYPVSGNQVTIQPVINHTAIPHNISNATASNSAAAVRQWQTVTAVQVPKLPPMLSEQDRIPKRGRPSKKMMQQNLKIKKDNIPTTTSINTASAPGIPVVSAKPPQQEVPEATPVSSKLVSMYTINDKGCVEEIAPKLKENRRSKERTQAFLKMLDDIKTASKQQMAMNPKFGEKAKTGAEKPARKRSKPRTKVFGRAVAQPLTESGITETMFTFSALAHQYKISNSILSRATENLLKSAAMKRSKEQSSMNIPSVDLQHSTGVNSNNKKGVSVSHCDSNNSTSSKATVPTIRLPPAVSKSFHAVSTASNVVVTQPVLSRMQQVASTNAVTLSSGTVEKRLSEAIVPQPVSVPTLLPQKQNQAQTDIQAPPTLLPSVEDPVPVTTMDDTPVNSKSKHKKKKHKKHKKHKFPDSKLGSGKKKKKDKERKKKSKKKFKTKLSNGVIPSVSVSVVKPPLQAKQDVPSAEVQAEEQESSQQVVEISKMPANTKNSFSSEFRQSNVNDEANNWNVEDNAYDGEDSSSDETSTSPKSYQEATSEKQSTTKSADNSLSSFAQYSNSTLGFGMFSSTKVPPHTESTNEIEAEKASKPNGAPNQAFSTSSRIRSKKHLKHKRKKFFRKSRNTCDPALLVLLDEILVSMKNLKLAPATSLNRALPSRSHANIFFATSIADSPQVSLWKESNSSTFSGQKSDSQSGIVKDAAFKKDRSQVAGRKSYSKAGELIPSSSKNHTSIAPSSKPCRFMNTSTLSVFCSAPFFQKYGYVSPLTQVSTSVVMTVSTQKSTHGSQPSKPNGAPTVSTSVLSASPSTTEKVQVSTVVSPENISPVVSKVARIEKRKRGWPLGKPRGPRAKKGKVSLAESTPEPTLSQIEGNAPDYPSVKHDAVFGKKTASDLNRQMASPVKSTSSVKGTPEPQNHSPSHKESSSCETESSSLETGAPSENENKKEGHSQGVASDLGKIVSESLLQQIKQAIAESLPAHPSVNKDAITKSVDAAVQSFMQNMSKSQSLHLASDIASTSTIQTPSVGRKKLGKRRTRSQSLVDNEPEDIPVSRNGSSDIPSRSNADKHPKKVWACKHHDTEVLSPSSVSDFNKGVSSLDATQGPSIKKRGPGRPRKYPLASSNPFTAQVNKIRPVPSQAAIRHGKVPTASATVVPFKRRPGSMAGRAILNCARAGMKRPVGRVRKTSSEMKSMKTKVAKEKLDSTISKKKAVMSVDAFCTAKALLSKIRSGTYQEAAEPGMYTGTCVEEHLAEAIDTTVDMYSWDTYKKFEEACMEVEREMNLENDGLSADSKRKVSGPKKSIESVIAKLKSKQAQTMHSTSISTVHLYDIPSVEGGGSGRKQKKVQTHPSGGNGPLKRPRGRPRKNPLPEEEADSHSSPKRPKLSSTESKHSSSKKDKYSTKEMKNVQLKAGPKDARSSKDSSCMRQDINPELSTTKPYLSAGLYSSTFKTEESSPNEEEEGSAEPVHLPPPFDAGLYLRSMQKDFQLPHNIWWMYKHHKIATSQDPSSQFIYVKENVYIIPQPVPNLGDHICTCKPPQKGAGGCAKQCLNRLMYIECSTSSCPCGDSCSNRAIQKAQWCNTLKRFKTADRGWGISTTENIPEGSFIIEYVGEVLSETEFRTRMIEQYQAYSDHYSVQLTTSTVIDAYQMGCEARFVNHSCEPNCEMQKWCVNGEYRVGLFALREIKPNEELTYDYNFHAYSVDQKQPCRCGSQKCRGFIGGRVQRSPSSESDVLAGVASTSVTKSAKMGGKQSVPGKGRKDDNKVSSKDEEMGVKEFSILQMKPLSSREREFIRIRQLFLIRNLAQVRRKEEQQQREMAKRSGNSSGETSKSSQKSKSKRSQQNKEEREKLYNALTEMYTAIATCKDQNGVSVAIPFMNLPSRKKNPEYYERIADPIDLSVIEHNLVAKNYKDIETFHSDVQRVFKNAEKYHGRKSTLGKDVTRLRKAYANARGAAMLILNGHKKPGKTCEVSDEDLNERNENIHRKNEDVIRCICCIYKDEGLMVQCEKCFVWQHCDCMGVKPGSTDRYLCEECDARPVSKEVHVIPPPPNTPPGHTYYVTLLRDNLLVKQGDCAYLMRDHRLKHSNSTPSVRAHRNLANIPQEKLDIFRIEKLWTDERGDKYAYGYHFLRPHETHHSPSRTFYHNELFASPFYEIIPLEAVVGLCMVMDLYTYCKGKPKDFKTSDIFICDFRVDKAASLFTRITKKRYPICTKPHVFDTYKHKLCPKKDFQPHKVPEHYKKSSSSRPSSGATDIDKNGYNGSNGQLDDYVETVSDESGKQKIDGKDGSDTWKKRQRLNGIAHKLLSKLPKQAVDVSYLLEPGNGKRQRKKTLLSLESLSQQK